MITKEIIRVNKKMTESPREKEIAKLEELTDLCKLNGWNEKTFLNKLSIGLRRWEEKAKEIFRTRKQPKLQVGIGCTINLFSDRRAATITRIISGKEIAIKENKTKCIDYYGSNYKILDELDNIQDEEIFTLRKGGTWVEKGQPKKQGSVTLTVGYRHHYIDPSF